jgi:hypothetical protein
MRKLHNIERSLRRRERGILNSALNLAAGPAYEAFRRAAVNLAWPELRRLLEAIGFYKIVELELLDATLPKVKLPKVGKGYRRAYVQCASPGCGWVGYYDYPPSGLILVDVMKPCRHVRARDFRRYVRDVPKGRWMLLYRARLARKPLPVGCAGYPGRGG